MRFDKTHLGPSYGGADGQQTDLRHLDVPNAKAAAEQFFSMVTGFQLFRPLTNVDMPSREIEVHVQDAVDTFLRAFKGRRQRGRAKRKAEKR